MTEYDDFLRTDFFYRHKPYRDFLSSLIWFPLLGLRIMTERVDEDEPEIKPLVEPPIGFKFTKP